jgi:hypothetical protein
MNWPWVSSRAYDIVVEQNTKMLDELLKIRRREAGMTEHPRAAPRPEAQEPAEIPDEFEEVLLGFSSEAVRNGLREQYRIRVANGSTPEKLYSELVRQVGPEEEVEA